MIKEVIKVFKHDPKAKTPTRNYSTDAGIDIFALEDVFLPLGVTVKVPTGVAIYVPEGYVGKIEDRSSIASKGVKTMGGVVDHAFTGHVMIIMTNLTCQQDKNPNINTQNRYGYMIKAGDKIAQMLMYRVKTTEVEEVSELWNSERGDKGLGSSGR